MEALPDGVAEFLALSSHKNRLRGVKQKLIRHYIETKKPFRCHYCNVPVSMSKKAMSSHDGELTIEHLKPISHFVMQEKTRTKRAIRNMHTHPVNSMDNLAIACYRCNNSMGRRNNQRTNP